VLRSAYDARPDAGTISALARRSRTSASNPVRVFGRARSGESAILPIAGGMPYVIPFGLMQPGDLIEAVEDLRVLTRTGRFAVATSPRRRAPVDGAELPDDSHGRRGVFTLTAVAPIDLAFTSGAPNPHRYPSVMPRYRTSARANVRSAATTASCARSRCILQIRPRPR